MDDKAANSLSDIHAGVKLKEGSGCTKYMWVPLNVYVGTSKRKEVVCSENLGRQGEDSTSSKDGCMRFSE